MNTPTNSEALPLTNCSAPVAWMRKWYLDGEKPAKTKNENGRWAWDAKYKFLPITQIKCLDDDIPLFTSVTDLTAELTAAREELDKYKSIAETAISDHELSEIRNHKLTEELTAAREELTEMTARAASLAAHLPPETICGDVQKWRDEYKTVTDQRDRLAKEVEILRLYGNKDCTAMADDALQSLTQNKEITHP